MIEELALELQEEAAKIRTEEATRRDDAIPLGETGEGIEGASAILIVMTEDGQRLLRPVGGGWKCRINDAIRQMDEEFPNCKMKILEENYAGWHEYFEPCCVKRQRTLGWTGGRAAR